MTATGTHTAVPRRTHAEAGARDAFTKGLRDLADWLDAHPGAPVFRWGHEVQFAPEGGAAAVAELGAGLGAPVEDCPALVRATVRFGPIAYVLWAPKARVPA